MEVRKRNKDTKNNLNLNIHTKQAKTGNDKRDTEDLSNNIVNFVTQNKFQFAFLVRFTSLVITQTFFVPDEYWQSTEVAHQQAFQYGYLTWEWKRKIRSYLYPFTFEIYFRILKLMALDMHCLVRYGPHFLQCILTTFCDVSVYNLSYKLTRCKSVALHSYFLNLSSWFIFYTGSRTLTNVAEMSFSTIGFSYFPHTKGQSEEKHCILLSLIFGGIACIIRPTCLLIWLPLILSALVTNRISIYEMLKVSVKVIPVLSVLHFVIDYYFYRSFTIVHWNFLQYNIVENIGEFYGTHSSHWYLTQGMPVVFGVHLLFVILGSLKSWKSLILWIAVMYVGIHR